MAPRKPTVNVEGLQSGTKSEVENYLDALFNRTSSLLDEMEAGRVFREAIAFETLLSAFVFFEDGFDHDVIKDGYPVQAWRDETVTIPKGLLRALIEAWVRYKEAPSGKTLGEAFNLEGGGQGKQPLKSALEKINRDMGYSNEVLIEYLAQSKSSQRISFEKAISRVAKREGKSHATIKTASEKNRHRTLDRMKDKGWIAE